MLSKREERRSKRHIYYPSGDVNITDDFIGFLRFGCYFRGLEDIPLNKSEIMTNTEIHPELLECLNLEAVMFDERNDVCECQLIPNIKKRVSLYQPRFLKSFADSGFRDNPKIEGMIPTIEFKHSLPSQTENSLLWPVRKTIEQLKKYSNLQGYKPMKVSIMIKKTDSEKTVEIPLVKTLPGSVEFMDNKNKTTLVTWLDGSKTAVRCSKDDTPDPEKAFLAAYFQKHSGLNKTQANKLLKSLKDN